MESYGKILRKRSHFAPYKGDPDPVSDESGDEEKGQIDRQDLGARTVKSE